MTRTRAPVPATVLAAALAAAAVLAGARPEAHAEYWVSRAADLFAKAKSIEIVRVTSSGPERIAGVVVESIRGRAAGEAVELSWLRGGGPPFAAGAELLVVCDAWVCPRAVGVDRGGWFLLEAHEPMDGAEVLPGLVERASVRTLAAGGKPPDLCLRAHVRFPGPVTRDAPAPQIVARLSAGTGEGEARGSLLGAAPRIASLLTGNGLGGAGHPEAVVLKVRGTRGDVAFIGGPLTRARDGCFDAPVMPAHPVARDTAALTRALDGPAAAAVIARGTAHLEATTLPGLRPGAYPVELAIDAHGQLHLACACIGGDGRVVLTDHTAPGRVHLGFSATPGSFYPLLLVELAGPDPLPGVGPPAALVSLLAGGAEHRLPLLFRTDAADPSARTRPAGYVTLRETIEPAPPARGKKP